VTSIGAVLNRDHYRFKWLSWRIALCKP